MSTLTQDLSPRLLRLAGAAEPDAALLARFVRDRDEAAFAALVHRHGPMVLGVCRRALGDWHAAEDACQATFHALSRNADRLRDPNALAAWLHGTAVRVALNARRALSRSGAVRRETPPGRSVDPLAEITGRELITAVDEELARLPEAFRAPLVLCCLEGQSHGEAARRLGWSAGSVKGRLERGRERLRQRLARRGIALPSALTLLAASDTTADCSMQLLTQTTRLAVGGIAPPAVALLAAAATGSWPLRRLTTLALLALSVLATAAIGGLEATRGAKPEPPKADTKPEPAAQKVDRFGDPLPPGALLRFGTTRLRHPRVWTIALNADNQLVSFGGDYVLRTWDPKSGRQLAEKAFEKDQIRARHRTACLSPDCRRVAFQVGNQIKICETHTGREVAAVGLPHNSDAQMRFSVDGNRLAVAHGMGTIRLFDLGTKSIRQLAQLRTSVQEFAFSRDGKRLACGIVSEGTYVWDVESGRQLLHSIPNTHCMSVDFNAAGEILAIVGWERGGVLHFIDMATGKPAAGWKAPAAVKANSVRFGPDGSNIVLGGRLGIEYFDPKSGKSIRTSSVPVTMLTHFSTDGRHIAAAWESAMQVWEPETGRSLAESDFGGAPTDDIRSVTASPDGQTIATWGSASDHVCVWGIDGRLKKTVPSNGQVFSADGRHFFKST